MSNDFTSVLTIDSQPPSPKLCWDLQESIEKPMPRPQRFDIEFDAPGQVYFSDQVITGRVVLEITEPLNLKGVKMRFKGECSIHFSETKKIVRKTKKKEKIFKTKKMKEMEKEMEEMKQYIKKTQISNGNCNGVDNPGYIPEENEIKQILTRTLPPGAYTYYSSSADGRYRPKSSESTWGEGIVKGPRQHFQAMETYFDCEFYIYGHKYQKDEKEMLPPGVHNFPFAFNLPPNLPPSFSSQNGIIRYMVAAVLDRPAAANLVRKAGFTILSILDLNRISDSTSSSVRSKSVNPCGLCCDTGPITLSMRIPRKGFVPGESIFVSADVDNISGRYTKRTILTLLQVITYFMPNKLKTYTMERIVRQVVRGTIAPGDSDFWENVSLQIPPVASGNLHVNSRLMRLEYKLEMTVELMKPWKDLKVSMPIIVGNVPLRSSFESFLPPRESVKNKQESLPGTKYQDFPSYSYAKCHFGEVTLEKQYEDLTGDNEYMGPPYIAETPYAPTYIIFTPGNNVSRSTSSSFDVESSVTS